MTMDAGNVDRVPPGVCPACLKPIGRKQLSKVASEFSCPHCQRLVRTSKRFRALLYLTCYGIPTVIVISSGRSLLAGIVLWLVLAFCFAMLFISVATAIRLPHLELFPSNDDEIRTLELRN
jgi:hypothetical protein